MTKPKPKFYFLFGIVIIIAILTPHVVRGHVLLPEKYAESAILTLDIVLAYVFYLIYKRDLEKINLDKNRAEKNLLDSYKYIGQSNVRLDLFNKFINSPSGRQKNKNVKNNDIFSELLNAMVKSVAMADKGLIRFVNGDNLRTIKEYSFHKDGDQFVVRLPNKDALENNISGEIKDVYFMSSDYINTKIRCIFCYVRKSSAPKVDNKLLKTLLNQVHLLFLVNNPKYC